MSKFFISFFFITASLIAYSQYERKYATDNNSPNWVVLMYQDGSDPQEVIDAYDAYFKINELQSVNNFFEMYAISFSLFSKSVSLNGEVPCKNLFR